MVQQCHELMHMTYQGRCRVNSALFGSKQLDGLKGKLHICRASYVLDLGRGGSVAEIGAAND